MGTTSVSTTKMMPFSMNNKVAIMKTKIIAMSKPNEKIIGYYTNFVEKYGKIYDELLEDDILGLKAKEGELPVTFKLPTSNNSVH